MEIVRGRIQTTKEGKPVKTYNFSGQFSGSSNTRQTVTSISWTPPFCMPSPYVSLDWHVRISLGSLSPSSISQAHRRLLLMPLLVDAYQLRWKYGSHFLSFFALHNFPKIPRWRLRDSHDASSPSRIPSNILCLNLYRWALLENCIDYHREGKYLTPFVTITLSTPWPTRYFSERPPFHQF